MTRLFDGEGFRTADRTSNPVGRPPHCPECGSRAIGTLAKIITPDTYWRCAACGIVWNQKNLRR